MIIQLLKCNIKHSVIARQKLDLVIFHLTLNKPYLLLLFFSLSFFFFLSLSDVLNDCY